jgi:hypothetical protein
MLYFISLVLALMETTLEEDQDDVSVSLITVALVFVAMILKGEAIATVNNVGGIIGRLIFRDWIKYSAFHQHPHFHAML